MLQVLFFARVREALDTAALELPLSPDTRSLEALREQLCQRGEQWREVLSEPNLIRAVNHVVVHEDLPLKDGDEVAFYPPVTGG